MTWALLPWTIPLFVQAHLLALLSIGWAWWGRPFYREGILMLPMRPGFDQRWDFTTTIAAAMWFSPVFPPHRGGSLWFHEVHVHVRQFEDLCCLAAILGGIVAAFGHWELGLGLWASSGPLWLVPGFLTAWPRYRREGKRIGFALWETLYRFSEHERSAYAQEAAWEREVGR